MTMNKINWKEYKDKRKALNEQEKNRVETNEDLARLIGEISEYRQSLGLSQRSLADKTGLKQPAIARMENLESIPRLDTVLKVSNALGYRLDLVNKSIAQEQVTIVIEQQDCSKCSLALSLLNNKVAEVLE